MQVYDDSPAKALRVGFLFIACKQEETEFVMPVFSVFAGLDSEGAEFRKYVDTQCRIYNNWTDWKENNCLPMLKYAYPTRGFFSCSGGYSYEFDEKKNPDVEYGTTPQCDFSSRLFRQVDSVSAVASLGKPTVMTWF